LVRCALVAFVCAGAIALTRAADAGAATHGAPQIQRHGCGLTVKQTIATPVKGAGDWVNVTCHTKNEVLTVQLLKNGKLVAKKVVKGANNSLTATVSAACVVGAQYQTKAALTSANVNQTASSAVVKVKTC
jgi:hypothetical protein